ncbi:MULTISPECIES: MFS transporter [unclassified Diaminobutyricimonas]|uniref:MFS transporter n=1 Tax=unclassified Diaminobutyricimonas TaxID=2643261 RepID=UPI0012F4A5AB|nr:MULTISPECIES: MFS transporter [unclassified Diaminobutyricimonas]
MTREQRLVLAIAILASFVAFLDGSVINVALPAITDELGGGIITQQWAVDAYLITLGGLILVAGSLSDVYGRISVIRWGLIGFGVASILCAIAPTAEFLIISRALQGVAGALLVPSSLAMIMSSFRDAAQAKAIGSWTAWTSGAFIAGPLIGGLLIDLISWRLVFGINVLPIAVTLWLLARLGHRDARKAGAHIDYPSAALAIIGIGGPVFALIEQGRYGWGSPVIWAPLGIGLLCFAAFLWRQHTTPDPMMPLSLFAVRNFAWGNLATTFIYAAIALGSFLIVVFLQEIGGYPATLAGLASVPVSVILIALSSTVGGLAGRHGPRLFMTLGPIVIALGYFLMLTITPDVNYWTQVLPGILLFGLGLAITVSPLTSAILGSIDPAQSGIGSAINNAIARVAGLIAIAFLGFITGPELDVAGFQRGLIVTAVLFLIGGAISFIGIRNPVKQSA